MIKCSILYHVMKCQNLLLLLLIGFFVELSAQEQIYYNDFESGDLNAAEYIGQPFVSDHITLSVWTNDSGKFQAKKGVEGDGISIKGNGTKSIFFEIQIEEGYQLDITGYNFWAKKTKASQGWEFLMNDVVYANGETDLQGSYISGDFEPALLNQTGIINVEYRVNGMGNGFYILDNFELFGQVAPICDQVLITRQPLNSSVCEGDLSEFFIETVTGSIITYRWQILVNGIWEDLTNGLHYTGVNARALSIENTPLDFNQNNYRCIVMVDDCEEISEEALLTVIALPETEPILYNN